MSEIIVSVIMPLYNEEKYISNCLNSLCLQTYPQENIEWLLIDGGSKDRTVEIIESYKDRLNIKILNNEKRIVTYALNLGIDNAIGKYIIRLDAHAKYAEDYIEKCIYYLENTDADNVGGIANTEGQGFWGKLNSEILTSKFGVGNSNFRTSTKSGYVDTVPFGAFRKELFQKIGNFNPELPRSEDNDLNSRIRSNGGKVYLATDITFTYYCRDTFKGLLDQGIKNGDALFLTLKKNPKAMSLRHYVPFLFLLSLIFLPVIATLVPSFWYVLLAEVGIYTFLNIYFSLFSGTKKYFIIKMIMYPMFHIVYGFGSLLGMLGIKLY